MVIKVHVIVLLLILPIVVRSQVDKSIIKAQAEDAAKATLSGDFKTALKYTYPKIARDLGGVEMMIAAAEKVRAEFIAQGIILESIVVDEASSVITAGNELHCFIRHTSVVRTPKGKATSEYFLIGVSADGGKQWFFIDTSNISMDYLTQVLPNYNPELVLPQKRPMVFTPN